MTLASTAVSRRAVLRGIASAGSALAVAGCAGMAANAPRFDASELTLRPTLLVATTRKPVNGARSKPWYGPERAPKVSVARAKLTPPDDGDVLVFGESIGSPMSLLPAIGVYAAIERERGRPLAFPGGPPGVYEAVDARLLARALAWASVAAEARGEAFNITNGDVFEPVGTAGALPGMASVTDLPA